MSWLLLHLPWGQASKAPWFPHPRGDRRGCLLGNLLVFGDFYFKHCSFTHFYFERPTLLHLKVHGSDALSWEPEELINSSACRRNVKVSHPGTSGVFIFKD